MDIFQAVILGIIEGLTEFLPISSTGHMILVGHFLGISHSDDFVKTFEIAIQLGSILAVLFILYERLFKSIDIWIKLIVGFVPTGLIGFFTYSYVKKLFAPEVVAYALMIGGVVFLAVEWWSKRTIEIPRKQTLESISYKEAFIVGICQSLAMIPGTSRSGATIIAGLITGFSRTLAAEFSFLLAIPTMFAATGYDLYKNYQLFNQDYLMLLLVGMVVAFFTSLLSVKFFLGFISRFNYVPFGVYRILVGVILLWYFWNQK